MRSRRAAFSLVLVPLLAAAFTLLRSVDPVRATEPVEDRVPAVCREGLPLPSEYEFRKSEYEILLGRFMKAECYKHLGWPHDVQIRPSGPTLATLGTSSSDPHLPAWGPRAGPCMARCWSTTRRTSTAGCASATRPASGNSSQSAARPVRNAIWRATGRATPRSVPLPTAPWWSS